MHKKLKNHQKEALTLDLCQSLCKKYTYFAVSKGTNCWCGNEFGLSGPTSQSCDVKCSGNVAQVCGGRKSHSVYRVNTQALRSVPTYQLKWTPQRSGGFPLLATAQSEGEGSTSKTAYVKIRATNSCPINITLNSMKSIYENSNLNQRYQTNTILF